VRACTPLLTLIGKETKRPREVHPRGQVLALVRAVKPHERPDIGKDKAQAQEGDLWISFCQQGVFSVNEYLGLDAQLVSTQEQSTHRVGRECKRKARHEPSPERPENVFAQDALIDARVLVLVDTGELLLGDPHRD